MTLTIELPPDAEQRLVTKAERDGESAAVVAAKVLAETLEWEEQDRQETLAGIRRGQQAFDEGRYRSFAEFEAEQRAKHGLPESP